ETLEGPDHVVDPQTVGPLVLRVFSTEHGGRREVLREYPLGAAQADLRRARAPGRTGSVEVDAVGGITGLILGVLVTNVFVTTQGRAVVLTWASVGLDLAYSLLI